MDDKWLKKVCIVINSTLATFKEKITRKRMFLINKDKQPLMFLGLRLLVLLFFFMGQISI